MSPRARIAARTASLGAAILALALVISGCAGDMPRPRPSATALPTGVSASIIQLRSDVADRQIQLEITNNSDEELEIAAVRVDDPRFAGVGRRVANRTSTIAPGATVDIRVQLPLMKCDVDPSDLATATPSPVPLATATAAPGEATSGASSSDASPSPSPSATPDTTITGPPTSTTVTVHYQLGASIAVATEPVAEPVPFLDDLYARECLAERVAKAASITIPSFTPSASGQPADLALSIRPTGAGDARVVGIQTTNLLTFDAGAGATADVFPLGVDAADAAAAVVVHLPLVPLRCDAHAVQEDKRGTVFTIDVELDGEPGEIELPAPADIKGQILTWIGQWCGFGS